MRRWLLLLFSAHFVCLSAQVADLLPRPAAIAAAAAARTDSWTAFNNPASLVQDYSWQLAAQYENRYLTKELSTAMVQAAWCNRYVNIGVACSFFGYGEWHEIAATLTLARSFKRFSLGLSADLITVYAGANVGYQLTAVPQIGAIVNITDRFALGIHTFNPFIQSLPSPYGKRKLPAIYTLASDWQFLSNMRWDVEASYDVNSGFRVATGYEWQAIEQLAVKLGIYWEDYIVPCMGLGFTFGNLRLDTNAELHPLLGVNLLARIGYAFR